MRYATMKYTKQGEFDNKNTLDTGSVIMAYAITKSLMELHGKIGIKFELSPSFYIDVFWGVGLRFKKLNNSYDSNNYSLFRKQLWRDKGEGVLVPVSKLGFLIGYNISKKMKTTIDPKEID